MINLLNRLVKQRTPELNQDSFDKRIAKLNANDCSLYTFAKALKKKKQFIPPVSKSSTDFAYSEQEKANTIAQSFLAAHLVTHAHSSPKTKLVESSLRSLRRHSDELFSPPKITVNDVTSVIASLKLNKAFGPDDISNRILRSLPKSGVELLTKIFNSCVATGHVPCKWKLAKIIPILKKGKAKSDPASYRPISLLSCVGKVLERIVLDRLTSHECDNKIFSNNQFGFRKSHSTIHQIILVFEKFEQKIRGVKLCLHKKRC